VNGAASPFRDRLEQRLRDAGLTFLSADFHAPIVIVQDRSATRTSLLEHILARSSRLPVKTPHEGEVVQPGVVYVARPDYHSCASYGLRLLWEGAARFAGKERGKQTGRASGPSSKS
jgi:CheB methylesterase